jgi:hypothetical protein
MVIKLSKIFSILLLSVSFLYSCELYVEYPTFAGIYRLVSLKNGAHDLIDNPEVEINLPKRIMILQGRLKRTNSSVSQRLIGLFDESEIEKVFKSSSYSEDLSEYFNDNKNAHFVYGSLNSDSKILYSLLDEKKSDTDSNYVENEGYVCRHHYGVNVDFKITPHKAALERTYTKCENLSQNPFGSPCVRPLSWLDAPINFEHWESLGQRTFEIKIEYFAKQINSPQYCDRDFNYKSIFRAKYVLETKMNMGDLRQEEENFYYKSELNADRKSSIFKMIKFPQDQKSFIKMFPTNLEK